MEGNQVHYDEMIVAMRRSAVLQSHPVRRLMKRWADFFEKGIVLDEDNPVVVCIPASSKVGEVVGHLVTTYSVGHAGEPCGHTEFQPLDLTPGEDGVQNV